uniref:Putative secreted protein n=1 Tax=Ixodes ricinus TaxID=34613 RepID=A0A6B0TV26_IXORI
MAAKWITCVGLCFANKASVSCLFVRSASLDETKTHFSSGRFSSHTTFSMALPTRPVPPVTRMTFSGGDAMLLIWNGVV